ncbi:MAG: response regulator [Bdellovibrionota bacterium]
MDKSLGYLLPPVLQSILVAEDDADDRLLIEDALRENNQAGNLTFVKDGEELMDYLLSRGVFAGQPRPRPSLIFLDLNMPKKDGREALIEIKNHALLKTIPVLVLTTSGAEEDVFGTYDSGGNSFVRKPDTYDGLVALTRNICQYWFETARLPLFGYATT